MAAGPSTHHTLEDLPYDEEKAEPLRLQLSLLKAITNNFSEEQVIGSGAYGVVYKAQLGDNFIAVKLLGSFSEIEGKTFEREVDCLARVKHHNIVGFVGYCAESHLEMVWQGAKIIWAESQKRLLCFEYMRNGSLRRHLITGEPCGLQWHVCYQIIKGMCQGLHHLHEKHIIHLDLKPDNILLDDDMVPKITDFGLSRLLGVEKSRTVTQNIRGSMGYMAPEYVLHGSITIKSDIYSLGVIIMQMLTGHKAEPIIENALGIWRCRLESETSQRHTPLEIGYQQVKACIEISTSCTEHKPENRPVTGDIIRRLGETVASGISTSPESNQFRKDVSAQVPQHASHPVHFEAQSQNPPFKGLSRVKTRFSEAAEDDPLPRVDDHQITGKVFPGRELQANGYSSNETTSCNFKLVRHLVDGSVNFIEGASQPSYSVADDVDTLLAVEVKPLNDRKRKAPDEMVDQVPQHASHRMYFEFLAPRQLDASFSEAAEDDPLPRVDDHQITGEVFPGRELQANGYSTNGTTSCNFKLVRHLDNGCVNFIKGARQPSYLVTPDDVDNLLAVLVEPLDDRERKAPDEMVAQLPQHASHPVHFDFEAQSQNTPFKGLSRSDVLHASFSEAAEDDPLPGIECFGITGEAFPGRELQACGYFTNGTTSCNFKWVRHFDDGSVKFIEGARQPSYLVTADDVDTLLAVEVEPLDDRERKGEIVKVYANEGRKITCDPETKELIEKTLEIGHVSYEVQLPAGFLDMWEPAVLAIKREGYSITCIGQRGVVLTEKFQQATAINVPYWRPTEFSIMSADGVEYNLKPAENTPPRDTIVLVLRLFKIRGANGADNFCPSDTDSDSDSNSDSDSDSDEISWITI